MPGGSKSGPSSSRSGQHHYLQQHLNGDDDDDDGSFGSIVPDRTGKHSFCRLCLTHSDVLNPLFPSNAAPDRNLLAQILDCVEVQITLPDDIKSFICIDCVQQVFSFASFKELCKSNDQLLKSQTFVHISDSEDPSEIPPEVILPKVTYKEEQEFSVNSEDPSTPDASLLEKLFQQGVEIEAIGQPATAMLLAPKQEPANAEEREAERKAKNAARMRRWRMRQRQKQEQVLVEAQEDIIRSVEQKDPTQLKQEDALRIQQAQEMFAILAQQQLRQVEAEIKRLKAGAQTHQQQPPPPLEFEIKPEPQFEGESSRQTSPTSDKQMASVRRSRAEYMRKWRAKRQTQQLPSSFGFVGRPPTLSPAPGETEKLILQRHNRAEYMRRWRRERLKQELNSEEFEEWCAKSEQRRRFREWQVKTESASSAGDDTMDYTEMDAERSYLFGGIHQVSDQS